MITRAIVYAVEKHGHQFRKGHIRLQRLPYVVHPIRVLNTIWRWGTTETVQVAAVLHDVLEDTNATYADIKDLFGKEVANIVLQLTFDPNNGTKEEYLASFKNKDTTSLIIKIADRLDNVTDYLAVGNGQYAKKYFEKAAVVFETFRERININSELVEQSCQNYQSALQEIEHLESHLLLEE